MAFTLTLETTAYTYDQIIAVPEAQIALAGRSNVGKSSLVNALAGRKQLAKVSGVPGKTRSINFYKVEPSGFYLVDLPGYGYARASHSEREKWATLLERYLTDARSIKALALLIDCRLPPQQSDVNLAAFARSCSLPVLPVLTKADKCSQSARNAKATEWQDIIGQPPIITSSEKKLGIRELWAALNVAAGCSRQKHDTGLESAAEHEQNHDPDHDTISEQAIDHEHDADHGHNADELETNEKRNDSESA